MSRVQFEFDLNGGGAGSRPSSASRAGADLFLGLQPTEAAGGQSVDIANDFMSRLGVAEAIRPLHVTLWELGSRGSFSTMDLAAKKEELSAVVFEPFMLTFDEIMSFQRKGEKKALVLCSSQPNPYLFELRRQIVEAQRQPGVEGGTAQAFTPHMTLFYSDHTLLRQRLQTSVRWLVRDFHMIWSHIGECRHESLWQWPPSA